MKSDTHVLDNPIWNALLTGDHARAWGNDLVRGIDRNMGAFVGMEEYSSEAWNHLFELTPAGQVIVMFTTDKLDVPAAWKVTLEKVLVQMVYKGRSSKESSMEEVLVQMVYKGGQLDNIDVIVDLGDDDIPAMLELTNLTKPGPFLQRTIDFGHYQGIFENGKLVSMAGQRFKPDPYTEVSAVCTHPDALGKGYAGKLINSQIRDIQNQGRIPFLHVYPDNLSAVGLYKKLGFVLRRELIVYVLVRS